VFIDDSKANVEGSEAVGLKGIHFKTAKTLVTDLKSLGVPI